LGREVDHFKKEGEDLRIDVERLKQEFEREVQRLKQEGEQVESEVERLKQEGEQVGSEVERLKQQVERLTKVVTPRSSFMPTGNRTMPGWDSSAYTRCQLLFSWTELNKVPSFIRCYALV
jgi:sugar-specific transcriptional regulator TrmB